MNWVALHPLLYNHVRNIRLKTKTYHSTTCLCFLRLFLLVQSLFKQTNNMRQILLCNEQNRLARSKQEVLTRKKCPHCFKLIVFINLMHKSEEKKSIFKICVSSLTWAIYYIFKISIGLDLPAWSVNIWRIFLRCVYYLTNYEGLLHQYKVKKNCINDWSKSD